MKDLSFKYPQSENNFAVSAVSIHQPSENDALSAVTRDYGLKPNGLTIEQMRDIPEFTERQDILDKAAVVSQSSGKLSSEVRKVVSAMRKLPNANIRKTSKSI